MKTFTQKQNLIRKAIDIAYAKHSKQTRKASSDPYINHPIMVSYTVSNFKKSKNIHELIIAAILHDTLEDTNLKPEYITKHFGKLVSSLVFELTDDKDRIKSEGKVEYQKSKWVGLSSYGLYIKLCDRLCNVLDNPKPEYKLNTIQILKHLKRNRKLSGSHKAVIIEIEKACEGI
jgi:(p)ppGpp synthase/HD superfamily hydrolase